MSKILVSPSVYASGVAKFGEDKFGALFRINPDHCDHESFKLRVRPRRHDNSGRYQVRITVETICLDCGEHNHGMEFWQAEPRR